MQITRHWRMQKQRYRLQGIRYQNGQVSLQPKRVSPIEGPKNLNKKREEPHVYQDGPIAVDA